jgi:hypothetical protein
MTKPMIAYMESSPKLSGKARQFGATYRRIALVELKPGFEGRPAMISERAHGVARILRDETVSIGATARSYGYRLREEYKAAADVNSRLSRTLPLLTYGHPDCH